MAAMLHASKASRSMFIASTSTGQHPAVCAAIQDGQGGVAVAMDRATVEPSPRGLGGAWLYM